MTTNDYELTTHSTKETKHVNSLFEQIVNLFVRVIICKLFFVQTN